jgi:hypothetical protein
MFERIQRPPFQVAVARDYKRWLRQEFPQSTGGMLTGGSYVATARLPMSYVI